MGRQRIPMHSMTKDALLTPGGLIKEARIRKGWTQKHLAGVAMTTQRTVSLIERGHPTVSIGTVFNVASAAGAHLFQIDDPEELARLRFTGEQKLALMPKRVVEQEAINVDLDF